MDILLLILGLFMILVGANFLVDGSTLLAKKFGISDFIIGMTIIGIGTSTPEMVVSFISAAKGNADIAVGNVIGSNIFNTLMILGLTAALFPITLTKNNIQKDIPFSLLAAFVLFIIGSSSWLDSTQNTVISRVDGILLLCFFIVFMAYTIFSAKTHQQSSVDNVPTSDNIKKNKPLLIQVLMIIGGLVLLIFGGDFFVESASSIAKKLGVSDAVIAITLMAGGTSLPELASCIVAARKKNTDMALGNVIGSNVSNIFLVLGGSAVIHPLNMNNIGYLDLLVLLFSSLLVFFTGFTFKRKEIDRIEGVLFVLLYIAFIVVLLNK